MSQKLIIKEPRRFFSYLDEQHFFTWLGEIPAIDKIGRVGNNLEIVLHADPDESSIRDLIAVMRRYELDMGCLRDLCTSKNEQWLKNTKAYWYKYAFDNGE